jgi:hypothetical protein
VAAATSAPRPASSAMSSMTSLRSRWNRRRTRRGSGRQAPVQPSGRRALLSA